MTNKENPTPEQSCTNCRYNPEGTPCLDCVNVQNWKSKEEVRERLAKYLIGDMTTYQEVRDSHYLKADEILKIVFGKEVKP